MRIGMAAGQQWALDQALHSLMLVSANDAAYALAEAASGNVEAFAADMNAAAARYGMLDSRFADPAGFDGTEGFNGGSRVSAHDLAIAARNFLAVPELTAIVGLREYRFDGPDGLPHVLYNHNKLLARYPGATGLKTGYTSLAGSTFVGTAWRDGRRMIAVVLNTTNMYGIAAALLDKGFATPADAPGLGVALPGPRVQAYRPLQAAGLPGKAVAEQHPVGGGGGSRILTVFFVVVGSTAGVVVALRRRAERRRRARSERRRKLAEIRRAAYLAALTDDSWDVEMAIPVQGQFDTLEPLPAAE
jgi:serine-type D-Ala-D-Ala carboxypeptidase (penicillin-binding protein 5/6)